ncbi:tetratricopeptide repeat protein [Posidoniimonas polymericola]|uniref:Tetratricopeptide repeat protein n=1 Tax=Posidoniimonas polymericola TaxID=2528002 RepID=A0A5C5YE05_9BACT|nr:tetratricopeptide repeat protein [Posidoniimonas polymericola]TWT72691.1 tetratricopeptide repeat protein [Posidoniimonas polymericola]
MICAPLLRLVCALCVLAPVGCGAFRQRTPGDAAVSVCRQFSCEGVTALEQGDCQQAESLLRRAVDAAPTDADARRHLAEALWARGEQAEAIRHMRVAVEEEPEHATAVCRLGQMEAAVGEWKLALRRAQHALQHDPKLADAWALRGRAHLETQQPDEALADLIRALEYSPNNRDVLADLARMYGLRQQSHRRLATVHRLLETYPHGEAPVDSLVMEADAYAALGRNDDAAAGLRDAAERWPQSPALLCRLAEAEAAGGRTDAAVAAAQRALAADQTHLPSQHLLARLSAQDAQLR